MDDTTEGSSGFSRRRALQYLGTLLSLAMFGFLLARQDWGTVWENVRRVPLWIPALAFACYLTAQLGNAWRWWMVLRLGEISLPYWTAAKIVFLGAFASNFLPSTVGGDTVRYLSLLRFTGRKGTGLLSLVVDRLLKMFAMFLLSPIAVVLFGPLLMDILRGDAAPLGAAILPPKVRDALHRSREALTLWFRRPKNFLQAAGVGFLSAFPPFLGLWLVARGLHMDVGLHHVIGASVITYFLTLLPISVNGYGVREVLITALYTFLGASVEQAAALAVITRVLMLTATLPGAFWLPEILAMRK